MNLGMALIVSGTTIATLVAGGAYCFLRMRSEFSQASIAGKEARVLEWQGSKGRVVIGGKEWAAFSSETLEIYPGAKVLVSRVTDDGLKIQPVEEDIEAVDLV
jgi:membrane protein implicated in regulation of membrane protease activity